MGLEVGTRLVSEKQIRRLLELSEYETPRALQCCGMNTDFPVDESDPDSGSSYLCDLCHLPSLNLSPHL